MAVLSPLFTENYLENRVIELWILFAIAASSTIFRTYARVRSVRWDGLKMDDASAWVGTVMHGIQAGLGYIFFHYAKGLANGGLAGQTGDALDDDSLEYDQRLLGSKLQVADWAIYTVLLWSYKISILLFYTRLPKPSSNHHRSQIYMATIFVILTFVANILVVFLGCQPFDHYWQISPNPGSTCQISASGSVIWVSYATNLVTDIYIATIPLPTLWRSSFPLQNKIGITSIFSARLLVSVFTTAKSALATSNPTTAGATVVAWNSREAFVSALVTNLPVALPVLKTYYRYIRNSIVPVVGKPDASRLRTLKTRSEIIKQLSLPSAIPFSSYFGENESDDNTLTNGEFIDVDLMPASDQIVVSKTVKTVLEDGDRSTV